MQEKPKRMKASLKLGPSFLIHSKTSKGVMPLESLKECFLSLKYVWWRFGGPQWLFYTWIGRLGFFWTMTHIHRVKAMYAWSRPAYASARTRMHEGRQNQLPLPIWSMIPPPRPPPHWFLQPKGLLKAHSSLYFQASNQEIMYMF